MTQTMRTFAAGVLFAFAGMAAHAAPPASDEAMTALAVKSGCMTCHHVDPGAKGPDGLPPIGPAWRDVAAKYRGQAGAQAELVRIVMKGSNPYDSHWKGKVQGLAMPPNAVTILGWSAGSCR